MEDNFFKKLVHYGRVWLIMSKNSFKSVAGQKTSFSIFLIAKTLRFIFFGAFLYYIVLGADSLSGYSENQAIFFFLTFNLIDITSQFLFREVYRFRPLVVSGDFDLILVKPMNPLLRVLLGGADLIDLITIPPLIFAIVYIGGSFSPDIYQVALYIFLLVNSMVIAAAFHIAVIALGIITLEIDHTILIYRDLTNLGKLPVDIYSEPLKGALTYLLPVGIMMTLPAKALMGLATPIGVMVATLIAVAAVALSLRFWKFALTRYTSASS